MGKKRLKTRQPTTAALSRPMMMLFLGSFFINAGSGIGLWLWPNKGWRIFHGWTIPLFLIVLGVIWRFHVVRAWQLKKNIISGMLTLAIFLTLTTTGWVIYYSGSDNIQRWAAHWHTWLGLGASIVLTVHAVLGWWNRESQ